MPHYVAKRLRAEAAHMHPNRRFYGCNLVVSDIPGPTEPMPLRDREIVADPEAVAQDLCADFADLRRADRA